MFFGKLLAIAKRLRGNCLPGVSLSKGEMPNDLMPLCIGPLLNISVR